MENKNEIQTELTPELAEKIWKDLQQKIYKDKVSKEAVLHHLKQLKSEMGKLKMQVDDDTDHAYVIGIENCMKIIDKKIEKVKIL